MNRKEQKLLQIHNQFYSLPAIKAKITGDFSCVFIYASGNKKQKFECTKLISKKLTDILINHF